MALPASVAAASAHGVVALDPAQRDYLSALLGQPLPDASSQQGPTTASDGGANGFAPAQLAEAAGRVAQVKDVLPGYGDGFITAALLVGGNSPPATAHDVCKH